MRRTRTVRMLAAFLFGLAAVTGTLIFVPQARAATATGTLAQSKVVSITGGYSSTQTEETIVNPPPYVQGWSSQSDGKGGLVYTYQVTTYPGDDFTFQVHVLSSDNEAFLSVTQSGIENYGIPNVIYYLNGVKNYQGLTFGELYTFTPQTIPFYSTAVQISQTSAGTVDSMQLGVLGEGCMNTVGEGQFNCWFSVPFQLVWPAPQEETVQITTWIPVQISSYH